jgi:hypothetical protein
MRLENCIKRLVETSKGTLNTKQAQEVFELLEAGKESSALRGEDYSDYILEKAKFIKEKVDREALIANRNARENIVKHATLTARIDDAVANGLPVDKAFQSILVGTEANVKDALYSIDKKAKSILGSELAGSTVSKLERDGLLEVWRDSSNSRQIAREMQAQNSGKNHKESSDEVKQIAKILNETQEYIRTRLNKAGADIGDLLDYIATTSHDQYKIQNASYFLQQRTFAQRLNPLNRAEKNKKDYEAWRDFILPKLDEKRTFADVDDVEAFMQGTYDSFVSGIHLKTEEIDGDLFALEGPSNLARKVSRERLLHFKDADAWHDYNDIFGTGENGLSGAIIAGYEKASRDLSLLETLGSNPKAMINRLVKDYKRKMRTTFDSNKILKNSTEKRVEIMYTNVSGQAMIANNPNLARFGAVTRGVQTMAKLGGAVLSSFSDIPVAGREITYQGENFFTGQAKAFSNIFKGRGNAFRRETGHLTGQGLEAMIGSVAARFSANDSLPGQMSGLMNLYFKFNGLTWWTDVGKIGISEVMAGRLAQLKDTGFSKLDSTQKRIFNYYGIEPIHWDIMRAGEVRSDGTARSLTADAIDDLDSEVIEGILKANGQKGGAKNVSKIKADAKSRFNVYFQDRTDHAILEPGARENSVLNLGLQRGTPEGEAIRFIMQFKSFPITFISKVWGREIYSKGKSDKLAMMSIVATMSLMGYVSMSAKDIARGKKPRNPFSYKTWLAAFLQGGGGGIFGDFLFGEYNRYGRGFLETAAGPTASAVSDIASTFAKIRTGEDFGASALNTVLSNTPFLNLFYIREPLNRMFIYSLQEYMNPGYMKRMQRRMSKENEQEFFIKP